MIALTRFHLAGYVRSLRVLHPLIAVFLLLLVVLLDLPAQPDPAVKARLITGLYGDSAAFLFPIWAWSARALLDTQPDVQRDLSALTQTRRDTPALAGIAAAYLFNIALGALALTIPLAYGAANGISAAPLTAAIALHLLAAFPATLIGGWTSRAILPSQATSILTLLATCLTLLLLSLSPLAWASVPMIEWLRAAHHGPTTFTAAFTTLATHLTAWSATAGAAYLLVRRHRP